MPKGPKPVPVTVMPHSWPGQILGRDLPGKRRHHNGTRSFGFCIEFKFGETAHNSQRIWAQQFQSCGGSKAWKACVQSSQPHRLCGGCWIGVQIFYVFLYFMLFPCLPNHLMMILKLVLRKERLTTSSFDDARQKLFYVKIGKASTSISDCKVRKWGLTWRMKTTKTGAS